MKIAFGCQSRVGKDTVCEYLQRKYGGNILHFSDPLYDILHYAQNRCGFSMEKDTKFLQWIGTEWGRQQDPDVWVRCLLDKVLVDNNDHFFVADLRFQNEMRALKENGFVCIRIVRQDRPIDRDQTHRSEVDLLESTEWDAVIENNGTVKELIQKVERVLERFKLA